MNETSSSDSKDLGVSKKKRFKQLASCEVFTKEESATSDNLVLQIIDQTHSEKRGQVNRDSSSPALSQLGNSELGNRVQYR